MTLNLSQEILKEASKKVKEFTPQWYTEDSLPGGNLNDTEYLLCVQTYYLVIK